MSRIVVSSINEGIAAVLTVLQDATAEQPFVKAQFTSRICGALDDAANDKAISAYLSETIRRRSDVHRVKVPTNRTSRDGKRLSENAYFFDFSKANPLYGKKRIKLTHEESVEVRRERPPHLKKPIQLASWDPTKGPWAGSTKSEEEVMTNETTTQETVPPVPPAPVKPPFITDDMFAEAGHIVNAFKRQYNNLTLHIDTNGELCAMQTHTSMLKFD